MKLLGETDAYFDVEGPGGKFRVAKNGLGKTTVAKIRGYAGGGDVKPEDLQFKSPGISDYGRYFNDNFPTLSNLAQTGADVVKDSANVAFNPLGALDQVAESNKALPGWIGKVGDAAMDTARAAAPSLLAKPPPSGPQLPARNTPPVNEQQQQIPAALLGPSGGRGSQGVNTNIPGPDMKAFNSNEAKAAAGVSDQANALEEQGRLAHENSDEVGGLQSEIAKTQQGFIKDDAAANAAEDASRQKDTEDVSNSIKQFSDAKIDQHALWASRSNGQKALAGIGLLFGAFSADGVNRAVGVMNDAINQDIDAQKSNRDALGKVVDEKRNLYNMNVEKFKDKRIATAATRLTMIAPLVSKIEAAMTRYKGTAQEATLAQAKGQLEQSAAQTAQSMRSAVDARAQEAAYQSRQIAVENRKVDIEQQRNDILAGKAAGKNDSGKLGNAALGAIDDLEKQFKKTGPAAFVGQIFGGTDSDQYNVMKGDNLITLATALRPGGKPPRNNEEALNILNGKLPGVFTRQGVAKMNFEQLRAAVRRAQSVPLSSGSDSGGDSGG